MRVHVDQTRVLNRGNELFVPFLVSIIKPMRTILLLGFMALTQFTSGQNDMLEPYRWENRLVLLFGSTDSVPVQQQLSELEKEPAEITDRDLLIFHIDGKEVRLVNQTTNRSFSADRFRSLYNISKNEFRYILLGKDGGVKLNKKEFVSNTSLFSIIDAMPMRQREMREKK